MLCTWPREKACRNIRQRVREVARSFPSNGHVDVVIQKLNPVLNAWCTYFRVGNSNRTFHTVDWTIRSELQLRLRRKHQCRGQSGQDAPWHPVNGAYNIACSRRDMLAYGFTRRTGLLACEVRIRALVKPRGPSHFA
jgi:hypothetical protein